jgi:putative FmdB family regulatory protein
MPLYEYQCENCGEKFEAIQKFADAPLTEHEKCGGPVNRLISAPALQFKGSGWYITDYAKSGADSQTNGDSQKKSDSGDSATSKEASPTKTESTTSSAKSSDTSSPSTTTSKPVSDKK